AKVKCAGVAPVGSKISINGRPVPLDEKSLRHRAASDGGWADGLSHGERAGRGLHRAQGEEGQVSATDPGKDGGVPPPRDPIGQMAVRPFGKYFLVRKLAEGGMAEIFL